ncbi:MAG: collagenase [Candidatus Komeilibacteria bacterium RIFOXYC1_FULL_37_11]|uniref:Collagenase n=1 Tax=Candidatus Komeilibacteria bacterium RIFOXYC1_FULL_37_11 TaxID=1798555 RepID=A0A1G2BW76_9BACT|nr:MAG: collagenase [Candidatus Komeilibacteria bacterium RIFOXYC1_FULL_37_11]OGY95576.1 MAG: collagenase [Candidatus Komeilibacteria bacterium RIFOXYD1_FULL_37_29]OGY96119.1 MAG: collagenase [Candidatus Komeilibacteria bacterium RIFOXYD2_FULL_37_8]
MPKKKYQVELLAPAGSYESLMAAIDNGADAVYFGVGHINMRSVSAANFNLADLKKIAQLCQEHKIKSYLTVNTVLYDTDLKMMRTLIDAAKVNKISAVIVSDMAAIQYAHRIGLPLHISTQLSVSNVEAVKFFSQYADQIVLARELNLKMIAEITKQITKQKITNPAGHLIPIEAFVHGALCIGISGRCSMSLYNENSSANRGACRQMCRRRYRVTDLETNKEMVLDNEFVMSPKDICAIGFLKDFLAAGVSSLKIEGRGRSPEYVATVVRAYREAIDSINSDTYTLKKVLAWEKKLGTVFNRGLSDGYYLGKPLHEWSASGNSQATEEKYFAGTVQHYFPKIKVAEILLNAQAIKINDKYSITGPSTGVLFGQVRSLRLAAGSKTTEAPVGQTITISVDKPVKKNDGLYIIKPRKIYD